MASPRESEGIEEVSKAAEGTVVLSPGQEKMQLLQPFQPSTGVVLGTVTTGYDVPTSGGCCWYCQSSDREADLFKPCQCNSFIHRDCFRKWRQGWINPRNYFNCPNCMYNYKIEQVKEASTESKERIRNHYRLGLVKLWLGTLFVIGAFVALIATIAYFSDTDDKNIPVAVKFMMTSVVNGFPNSNSTAEWREDFKEPGTAVWPYYSLLGLLVTSILILIGFCAIGCTFDEKERRQRNCCQDCCGGGSSSTDYVWCYCYDPCPDCNCNINCVGCCQGNFGSCSGGDCKCDGDAGQALVILLVVIIVIIIFSAIIVVILYTVQKGTLLYDRMTAMLLTQAQELEGETVVLAVNESWRPVSEV